LAVIAESQRNGATPPDIATTRVECPHSGHLWFEIEGLDDPVVHRVVCKCKRPVRFRVEGGQVVEIA
jgi:hypothetical protein